MNNSKKERGESSAAYSAAQSAAATVTDTTIPEGYDIAKRFQNTVNPATSAQADWSANFYLTSTKAIADGALKLMGTKGYQVPESSEVVLPAIPANTPIALVQTTDPIPYAALQYMQYFDCALKNLAVAEETTVTVALVLTKEGEGPKILASFDYTIVPVAANVAKIGNVEYPTLGAAIAALTGGETIKLLDNYTAADTEVLVFEKSATLDLGGFELTVPPAVLRDANEKMWFKVADGAEVSFENGTITMGDSAYGLQVHGTAIVSCTMTKNDQTKSGPLFDIYGVGYESTNGGTVYVVNGADLQSDCDIFRHKKKAAKASVIISGGTMTATAIGTCNHQGIFFGSAYPSADDVVTITGGKFIGKFDNASEPWGNGNIKFGAEASAALFDGTAKLRMANYLADGYELVESTTETGFWQIAKIPSFDVTFTKNTTEAIGSTNVLRDTALTVEMIPAVEGGTWDVDPVGAVITCNTNFNYTVKAGPDWPEDWPKDVPDDMKEAFQTWAEGKGTLDFSDNAVKNAFLMNDEVGAVTALKIESISVEGTTATIVVSATGKDLENGINGVLYIDAANDLTNWTTTEVETNADFTDGKATFTVDAAKFMKAGVGFKAPVVE